MRRFLTLLAAGLLGGFLAVPCEAENMLYVAANGNDHNPGTAAKPFQHIQRAAPEAKPGDVICVDNGVYQENISFHKSGDADAWITLRPLHRVDVQKGQPLVKITPKAGPHAVALLGHSYLRIGLEISEL